MGNGDKSFEDSSNYEDGYHDGYQDGYGECCEEEMNVDSCLRSEVAMLAWESSLPDHTEIIAVCDKCGHITDNRYNFCPKCRKQFSGFYLLIVPTYDNGVSILL